MGVELNAHKNDKNDMEKAILVLTLEIQNLKNISNTLMYKRYLDYHIQDVC